MRSLLAEMRDAWRWNTPMGMLPARVQMAFVAVWIFPLPLAFVIWAAAR